MPSTPAKLLESAPSLCSNSDGHSAPGCPPWRSVRGPRVAVEAERVARRSKTTGHERARPPRAGSPIENKTTEEYGSHESDSRYRSVQVSRGQPRGVQALVRSG